MIARGSGDSLLSFVKARHRISSIFYVAADSPPSLHGYENRLLEDDSRIVLGLNRQTV